VIWRGRLPYFGIVYSTRGSDGIARLWPVIVYWVGKGGFGVKFAYTKLVRASDLVLTDESKILCQVTSEWRNL
jgi:hypothetical protein